MESKLTGLFIGLVLGITLLFVSVFRTASLTAASSAVQQSMLHAARNFFESCGQNEQTDIRFPFASGERSNWHYIPRNREGIPLKSLSGEQKTLGFDLLHTALTSQGYDKATGIIKLEGILRRLEGRGPEDTHRDPGKYYYTLFGDLSEENPWGWRLEGHHLSLNFTLLPNDTFAITPAFFGTDPAIVPSGPEKGMRVLTREETLARELVRSLSSQQRDRAVIREYAPREIITGADREINPLPLEGIPAVALSENQRMLLMELLNVYFGNFRDELVRNRMQTLRETDKSNIHFTWAGGLEPGEGHYYRIQAPHVLIEYDNTQDNANHIHTVIRDPANDFGRDLLKEHYEVSHQH